jgi:hypothetical protein
MRFTLQRRPASGNETRLKQHRLWFRPGSGPARLSRCTVASGYLQHSTFAGSTHASHLLSPGRAIVAMTSIETAELDDDQQSHRCREIAGRARRSGSLRPRPGATLPLARKRATMSMPWLLLSATAAGQRQPRERRRSCVPRRYPDRPARRQAHGPQRSPRRRSVRQFEAVGRAKCSRPPAPCTAALVEGGDGDIRGRFCRESSSPFGSSSSSSWSPIVAWR